MPDIDDRAIPRFSYQAFVWALGVLLSGPAGAVCPVDSVLLNVGLYWKPPHSSTIPQVSAERPYPDWRCFVAALSIYKVEVVVLCADFELMLAGEP